MTDDERRERAAEIEDNRQALVDIARSWGFEPDERPRGAVAETVEHLGTAVQWTARHRYLRNPTALRWLGVTLEYWSRAMREWAAAADAAIADEVATFAAELDDVDGP